VLSILAVLLAGMATFTVTAITTSGSLIWSDGLPYFLYSRSLALDFNTDLTNEFNDLQTRYPPDSKLLGPLNDWSRRNQKTGRITTPWPIGMGIVMLPFYAAGYAVEYSVATISGRAPDSYGLITQYFYCTGALAFGLLGFWSIFLCCREVTDSERIAYLASFGIIFAGPAVFYIFFNPSMAHAPSLGLLSLLTLFWLRQWRHGSSPRGMALLGILLGFAAIVRYQNVLFGILPAALLLREAVRVGLFRAMKTGAAGFATLVLPASLQLLHLHYFGSSDLPAIASQGGAIQVSGYPLDPASPYFFDVLFSSRHGAYHWAPVLLAGTAGALLAGTRKSWAWPLLLVFIANTYLIGALGMAYTNTLGASGTTNDWLHHWNGASSFGMRYLTECAPVFAIGLAVLIQATPTRVGRLLWPAILITLIIWNQLLILAYGLNTISRSYSLSYTDMLYGIKEALQQLLHLL
jgi:hypothetical protein